MLSKACTSSLAYLSCAFFCDSISKHNEKQKVSLRLQIKHGGLNTPINYPETSLAIPKNWRSLPTDCLRTSKCKAVAGTVTNKATPLAFFKRRRLPRNSALPLFSSVGEQTSDIASHFSTRRELFITLKLMPRATLDMSQ